MSTWTRVCYCSCWHEQLSDTSFDQPGVIDVLIRGSIFFDLLQVDRIKFKNRPTLPKTLLGWVDLGMVTSAEHRATIQSSSNSSLPATLIMNNQRFTCLTTNQLDDPHNTFKKFCETEEIVPSTRLMSLEKRGCATFFNQTTHYSSQSKCFTVQRPFWENLSSKSFVIFWWNWNEKWINYHKWKVNATNFCQIMIKRGHMTKIL